MACLTCGRTTIMGSNYCEVHQDTPGKSRPGFTLGFNLTRQKSVGVKAAPAKKAAKKVVSKKPATKKTEAKKPSAKKPAQ